MNTRASRWTGIAILGAAAACAPASAQLDVLWSHPGRSACVAFSPDGATLANGGGGLELWDALTGAPVLTLTARFNDANSVAFSPDGRLIADGVQSFNQNLNMWSLPGGALVHGRITAHSNGAEAAAFSPDGALLATGGRDGTAKLWSVPDLTLLGSVPGSVVGYGGRIFGVAFSPDGRALATTGQSGVALWRTGDRSLIRILIGAETEGSAVAFSHDGALVASAFGCTPTAEGVCTDGSVRIWQVADGSLVRTLRPAGTDGTLALAFSPDDSMLATGGDAGGYDGAAGAPAYFGVLRFWRVADGALADEFRQDVGDGSSAVTSVAYSADGGLLAFCRYDGVTTVARAPGNGGLTACRADFNRDGHATVQDVFDFLGAYFTGAGAADVNGSGGVSVEDVFDFLGMYFVGC